MAYHISRYEQNETTNNKQQQTTNAQHATNNKQPTNYTQQHTTNKTKNKQASPTNQY